MKFIKALAAAALAAISAISVAAEDSAADVPQGLPGWVTFVVFGGMILLLYFLMIRPQKKQEQQMDNMRNNLKVGDEVVTIGGIVGTVIIIRDDKLMIETGNDKTKLTMMKTSVKSVLSDNEEK